MKKTTKSLKLSKQLAKYGALTAAMASIADASGQIVFTDVDPDFSGNSGDEFFLDLNQDAINDFRVHQSGYNLFIEPLTASNSVLGSGAASYNYVYPYALSSGAVISSGQNTWLNQGFSAGYQSLNYGSSSTCYFGNWCSETDKFLGLRFTVGGNIHYGWAKLDATFDNGWTIKEFAYNTTVDESIEAGQQTLGVSSNDIQDVRVVGLNKSIGLYNLTEATEYTLYNIEGKQLLNGKIENVNSSVIEANQMASGIYILELNTLESNSTLRKKVVL
ncbi:MAG: hypothetical protein CMC76_01910 [Flavobacteriaceae bacterium]|uniref:T9SS type A sorting domain-containing protein n=1 Tax=Winogradskyella sp. SYSU M77433 TaxID=3042722 RepID=UPI000C5CBFE3|nr:T9SS type A sorting domain-containing protein [Winogradskyella sp. SYSU M77433]MAX69844.1 hypothetical protein [Flavobacteriaceae bacterium]MDH7912289.1 T9SS type A sorting domain-containing protein [Winogradskyella sp. SYSU M77433]|tara:strand:- start:126 stop:950 length:825 start_codon:yes stop_codon:yes gene_type:complete